MDIIKGNTYYILTCESLLSPRKSCPHFIAWFPLLIEEILAKQVIVSVLC